MNNEDDIADLTMSDEESPRNRSKLFRGFNKFVQHLIRNAQRIDFSKQNNQDFNFHAYHRGRRNSRQAIVHGRNIQASIYDAYKELYAKFVVVLYPGSEYDYDDEMNQIKACQILAAIIDERIQVSGWDTCKDFMTFFGSIISKLEITYTALDPEKYNSMQNLIQNSCYRYENLIQIKFTWPRKFPFNENFGPFDSVEIICLNFSWAIFTETSPLDVLARCFPNMKVLFMLNLMKHQPIKPANVDSLETLVIRAYEPFDNFSQIKRVLAQNYLLKNLIINLEAIDGDSDSGAEEFMDFIRITLQNLEELILLGIEAELEGHIIEYFIQYSSLKRLQFEVAYSRGVHIKLRDWTQQFAQVFSDAGINIEVGSFYYALCLPEDCNRFHTSREQCVITLTRIEDFE